MRRYGKRYILYIEGVPLRITEYMNKNNGTTSRKRSTVKTAYVRLR